MAATPVVPEPAKKSTTVAPGITISCMNFSTSSTGCSAICSRSFGGTFDISIKFGLPGWMKVGTPFLAIKATP